MTIGLVIPSTPSYSETFFNSKIKGLQGHGFKVVVFTQTVNPNFNLCEVVRSPKVKGNKLLVLVHTVNVFFKLLLHLKRVIRYYRLLKDNGFSLKTIIKRIYLNSHILINDLDWLHFGFATQAIGSEYVAKAIGAKMAISFRGFDINVYPLKHPNCYLNVWKNVDKVHSISRYLVEEAYNIGLEKLVPVSIITPAVDERIINKFVGNQYSKDYGSLSICTVARLHWIKDLTTALETIKILKNTLPHVVYHIIGDGHTKERERYLFMVNQLALEENVIFHWKLSHNDTLELVSRSDIYLQTSLNEGFCNAVLEAQALGRLCIVSDVGGLKENLVNGKTGWLVKSQQPQLFAKKIVEVIELSEKDKKTISQNAINRVQKNFLLSRQNSKFVQFYTTQE
ncbi:glycosyltransferase family 4 protein [uncultured Winogradskyella sp.]|uniref:glycosyltransferase family 4 protein n=1 Tax=uncultured Winogradskyella sp. TaxID=395353 RepID=UPI003518AF91